MTSSSLDLPQLIREVFTILGLSAEDQSRMLADLDHLANQAVLQELLQTVSAADRDAITETLKTIAMEQERVRALQEFLRSQFSKEYITKVHQMTLIKLLSDYFRALRPAATSEQRSRVQKLLDSIMAQP